MPSIAESAFVTGTGPIRVLALHGWFGSARAWKPFVDLLDPARYSIACLDYRGYGARITETGNYTLEEIAADATRLADALGWDRFHLMGHSMGGKAILRALLAAPERIGRLLAVTPVPACPIPFDAATWELFCGAESDLDARRTIIDHSTGQRLSKHWTAMIAAHSWSHSRPEAFGAYLRAWALSDFASAIAGSPASIHLVVGEHDPSLTSELMRSTTMGWFPNATLEAVANAGHYPADETPVALATIFEKVFGEPA